MRRMAPAVVLVLVYAALPHACSLAVVGADLDADSPTFATVFFGTSVVVLGGGFGLFLWLRRRAARAGNGDDSLTGPTAVVIVGLIATFFGCLAHVHSHWVLELRGTAARATVVALHEIDNTGIPKRPFPPQRSFSLSADVRMPDGGQTSVTIAGYGEGGRPSTAIGDRVDVVVDPDGYYRTLRSENLDDPVGTALLLTGTGLTLTGLLTAVASGRRRPPEPRMWPGASAG